MRTLPIAVNCLLITAFPALAQVPGLINHQGRLVQDGKLVNGDVTMVLRLYNVATGDSPACVDASTVTVADGLYNNSVTGAKIATGTVTAIGGGGNNDISSNALYATVSGGRRNTINSNSLYSTVSGDKYNAIGTNALSATVGGAA